MPKGKGYICLCLSKYVGRRQGEEVSGFLGKPWLRGEGAPQAEGRHSDRAVLQSLGSLPNSHSTQLHVHKALKKHFKIDLVWNLLLYNNSINV